MRSLVVGAVQADSLFASHSTIEIVKMKI